MDHDETPSLGVNMKFSAFLPDSWTTGIANSRRDMQVIGEAVIQPGKKGKDGKDGKPKGKAPKPPAAKLPAVK